MLWWQLTWAHKCDEYTETCVISLFVCTSRCDVTGKREQKIFLHWIFSTSMSMMSVLRSRKPIDLPPGCVTWRRGEVGSSNKQTDVTLNYTPLSVCYVVRVSTEKFSVPTLIKRMSCCWFTWTFCKACSCGQIFSLLILSAIRLDCLFFWNCCFWCVQWVYILWIRSGETKTHTQIYVCK